MDRARLTALSWRSAGWASCTASSFVDVTEDDSCSRVLVEFPGLLVCEGQRWLAQGIFISDISTHQNLHEEVHVPATQISSFPTLRHRVHHGGSSNPIQSGICAYACSSRSDLSTMRKKISSFLRLRDRGYSQPLPSKRPRKSQLHPSKRILAAQADRGSDASNDLPSFSTRHRPFWEIPAPGELLIQALCGTSRGSSAQSRAPLRTNDRLLLAFRKSSSIGSQFVRASQIFYS